MLVLVELIDKDIQLPAGCNKSMLVSVINEVDLSMFIYHNMLNDQNKLPVNIGRRNLSISDLRITEIKDDHQGIILMS